MAARFQVAIDCADPAELGTFWAASLGYVRQSPPEPHESWEAALAAFGVPESEWNAANALVDPDGTGPRIYFQRVPEAKAGKNRLHLDVHVSSGPGSPPDQRRRETEPTVEKLVALGATDVARMEELGGYWAVMQDPEGNEFCIT